VLTILIAGLAALWLRSWVGLAVVAFFLILAPTSTIVPIADLAVEHRMYLPLACVSVLTVGLAVKVMQTVGDPTGRCGVWLLAVPACLLGALTIDRNRDFRTEADLWATVVQTAPGHFRGHSNLAKLSMDQAREVALRGPSRESASDRTTRAAVGNLVDFAVHHYRIASGLRPAVPDFHFDLARALMEASAENKRRVARGETLEERQLLRELSEKQLEEAVAELRTAIELNPRMARAYNNLGAALDTQGKLADAVRVYQKTLELRPNAVNAHMNLGTALVRLGRMDEGLVHLRQAVELKPDYAAAHRNLAIALRKADRRSEAQEHQQEAEKLDREAR
jgi:Flp pilus assembly protein TadD